jgi:hypothetical protein
VHVLNINELANSLKPVVLPGEVLKVFILKEGKEPGQGVAYLDDGTMVVVDQGKRAMGRTIEVVVTSVLQTTAGKMIFCRWPELAAAGDDSGRQPKPPADRTTDRFERRNGRREGERTDRLHAIERTPAPTTPSGPADPLRFQEPRAELSTPAPAAIEDAGERAAKE